MRWNCPHCLTMVSVSDEKIGTGWLFSKCYKCNGFSLVRRAEVEVVKVDGSPFDGKISVSSNASGIQAKIQEIVGEKKEAEAKLAATVTESMTPTKSPARPEVRPASPIPRIQANALFEELKAVDAVETQKKSPFHIIAGVIAVAAFASGAYLYFEGQSQLQKRYKPKAKDQATVVDQVRSESLAAPIRDP